MKNKKYILAIISLSVFAVLSSSCFCAAETEPLPLAFSAVNAGYKDEISTQNYDFIELKKNTPDLLDLSDYKLIYYNSSDKETGSLSFEGLALTSERLILGYAKSPQYQDAPEEYRYTFSSSGLASTAGRLVLMLGEEVADEICWGKTACEKSLPKFATKPDDNYSAILAGGEEKYQLDKYYAEIDQNALVSIVATTDNPEPEPEPELEPEPEPEKVSCAGLRITEVLGYYEENSSEQFIEIFNSTNESLALDGCRINYKKDYPLTGIIDANNYMVISDIPLTKNPTNDQNIYLLDDYGVVDAIAYPHGQKKGTALALYDGEWRVTYAPTPGAENAYQEFRSCPEGKIINPETGNCIKEESLGEAIMKQCPEGKILNPLTGRCKNIPVAVTAKTCQAGYSLNPLTGRCKKNETAAAKTCPEGYERNPETNRCRKVYKNTAQEFPVEPIEEGNYDNPRIFIAVGALVLLGVVAAAYIVWQFREEIRKFFVVHFRRKRGAI
jgi:hypothetical protein